MLRLVALLGVVGCAQVEPFVCGVSSDCDQGFCVQDSSRCSRASDSCDSGQVYDDSAGELAGQCAPAAKNPAATDLLGTPTARYFIDEEPESTVIKDYSGYGNDLAINIDNAELIRNPDGNQGLRILASGKEGGASKQFEPDTGVWATEFHGTQSATIELVVDVESGIGRSIFFVGPIDGFGSIHLSSYVRYTTHIWSEYAVPIGTWSPEPFVGQGRKVIHIVNDWTQEAGVNKLVMYVDCIRYDNSRSSELDGASTSATISAAAPGLMHRLVLGGRRAFSDSDAEVSEEEFAGSAMGGTIYYAAVYPEAFDSTQRLNNCRSLQDSDDIPRAP